MIKGKQVKSCHAVITCVIYILHVIYTTAPESREHRSISILPFAMNVLLIKILFIRRAIMNETIIFVSLTLQRHL